MTRQINGKDYLAKDCECGVDKLADRLIDHDVERKKETATLEKNYNELNTKVEIINTKQDILIAGINKTSDKVFKVMLCILPIIAGVFMWYLNSKMEKTIQTKLKSDCIQFSEIPLREIK